MVTFRARLPSALSSSTRRDSGAALVATMPITPQFYRRSNSFVFIFFRTLYTNRRLKNCRIFLCFHIFAHTCQNNGGVAPLLFFCPASCCTFSFTLSLSFGLSKIISSLFKRFYTHAMHTRGVPLLCFPQLLYHGSRFLEVS